MGTHEISALARQIVDRDLDDAIRLGAEAERSEVCALFVRYDRSSGRVVVTLSNGRDVAFSARQAQGLEHGDDDALDAVEIAAGGRGLHWPRLDADVSVAGLLAGLYGTRSFMDRQRAVRGGPGLAPARVAASPQ